MFETHGGLCRRVESSSFQQVNLKVDPIFIEGVQQVTSDELLAFKTPIQSRIVNRETYIRVGNAPR